jgi:dienelactone hydrolase
MKIKAKNKRKQLNIREMAIVVAFAIVLGIGAYIGDYYRADENAMSIVRQNAVVNQKNGMICFGTEDSQIGLIFYPGGKVQYEAYSPLLEMLAEHGIFCVLVHMPANLAVFDVNAADDIREMYPDIENWYIGGHSLGGAMAASYVAKHSEDFSGLILLAAYSTADLSDSGLSVVSIYGNRDEVLDRDKYEKCLPNLPDTAEEVVIEGGCHSYFGSYGMQEGDGEPTITREEQMAQTVEAILIQINR